MWLQVLYDSLVGDPFIAPRIPPRLLDLLEYHRTLIFYDDDEEFFYDNAEQQVRAATLDPRKSGQGQYGYEGERDEERPGTGLGYTSCPDQIPPGFLGTQRGRHERGVIGPYGSLSCEN